MKKKLEQMFGSPSEGFAFGWYTPFGDEAAKTMMTDLKSLRKMTGLTQYELARESGVARGN